MLHPITVAHTFALDLLHTPGLAIEAARHELRRMGNLVAEMVHLALPATVTGTPDDLNAVRDRDEAVDAVHAQIVRYLGLISRRQLGGRQTRELMALMSAANDLESIGDIVETSLVGLGRRRLDTGVVISEATQEVLTNLHRLVERALAASLACMVSHSHELAMDVVAMKVDVQLAVAEGERHQARRLVADEPDRLDAYTLEVDIIDKLRRIYYHAKRVAKAVAEASEP